MQLTFTIDTDEIYGQDLDFETLLSDGLKAEIVKHCKDRIASDDFKAFKEAAADAVMANVKLKMERFLSEDIALTDRWGKPTFIGSVEDLIKSRFDDVIIRPVDISGNTLEGCTSSSLTWIEWIIKKKLDDFQGRTIDNARDAIAREVSSSLKSHIAKMKNDAIHDQVGVVFAEYLQRGKK